MSAASSRMEELREEREGREKRERRQRTETGLLGDPRSPGGRRRGREERGFGGPLRAGMRDAARAAARHGALAKLGGERPAAGPGRAGRAGGGTAGGGRGRRGEGRGQRRGRGGSDGAGQRERLPRHVAAGAAVPAAEQRRG